MSLPTADLPEPLAVLVLAWDEAAPAVRALVAATQASTPIVDSILVMVPQPDAPTHLSAEEYLPLAFPLAGAAPPAVETAATPLPEAAPPPAETPPPAPAATTILRAESLEEDGEPATDDLLLTGELPGTLAQPALGWSAVRVLRLGSYSLPQLASRAGQPLPAPVWLGLAAVPAAPYLGAELPATTLLELALLPAASERSPLSTAAAATATRVVDADGANLPVAPDFAAGPPLADTALTALSQAAALETDFLPQTADELAQFELASFGAITEENLATEPEQAGWPEALAALRQSVGTLAPTLAAVPTHTAEAPVQSSLAALRPAATHYPAPDLNFRIIQYARFAVPVALAEPPFAVLYAPAWPTWLAAQELRQRTGRPLVLHVASLAAGNEPVGTATGWIAELQRQALHRADLILTETPALAERLGRELGLAAGTVRVVAAADAAAIAQALHEARPRPAAGAA